MAVLLGLLALALASEAAADTPPRTGIVNVVSANNVTSQPFPDAGGERTTSPLSCSDSFPPPCTTCDAGTTTEYCDLEEELCVRLSNYAVSVIHTNVTLSSFALDNRCTPWRFQKLSPTRYVVLCADRSYQVFDMDDLQLAPIQEGQGDASDAILVMSGNHPYYVELIQGIIIVFDIFHGTESPITSHYAVCQSILSLHSIDSSNGKFILSCETYAGEQAYLLYSVHVDNYEQLDLCGGPLSYPDSYTFAVTCDRTVAVYMKDDAHSYTTKEFDADIISRSYLDNGTLLVDMGDQKHIVNLDLFLHSGGYDGVITLNTSTNCSVIQKLIGPQLYTCVCHGTEVLNVLFFNTSTGDEYPSMNDLTTEPLDIYFQQTKIVPSPPQSETTTTTTSSGLAATASPASPTVHLAHSVMNEPPQATSNSMPGPTTVVDAPPEPVSHRLIIYIVMAILVFVLGALVVILTIIYVFKRSKMNLRRKRYCYPIEESSAERGNQLSATSPCVL